MAKDRLFYCTDIDRIGRHTKWSANGLKLFLNYENLVSADVVKKQNYEWSIPINFQKHWRLGRTLGRILSLIMRTDLKRSVRTQLCFHIQNFPIRSQIVYCIQSLGICRSSDVCWSAISNFNRRKDIQTKTIVRISCQNCKLHQSSEDSEVIPDLRTNQGWHW